jgi:hypothetical protein
MNTPSASDLMKRHGIARVVYVEPTDLSPGNVFHAWPRGVTMAVNGMGRGATIEEAIHDAVAKLSAKAA